MKVKNAPDSEIVKDYKDMNLILSLFPNIKKFSLLLRGSADGFSSQVFH